MVRAACFKYASLPVRISTPIIFPTRTLATAAPIAMPIASSKSLADVTPDVGGQANVDQLHRVSRDFRSESDTVPRKSTFIIGTPIDGHYLQVIPLLFLQMLSYCAV